MIKQAIFAIIFTLIAYGLTGCAQSEPDAAEVDSKPEVAFEGPAFVLFFTDP